LDAEIQVFQDDQGQVVGEEATIEDGGNPYDAGKAGIKAANGGNVPGGEVAVDSLNDATVADTELTYANAQLLYPGQTIRWSANPEQTKTTLSGAQMSITRLAK
jgi:hypothetical protein